MPLSDALKEWNGKEEAKWPSCLDDDYMEDVTFIRGYQQATYEAMQLVMAARGEPVDLRTLQYRIAQLDDVEEPVGN